MILEPEKFRAFEHAGWELIPTGYHEAFGSLTSQAITPLLDAARVKSGMTFLDIASGPGYVAAAAANRGATVLGVDFSAAMVAHAQTAPSGHRVSRRRRRTAAVGQWFVRCGGDEFRHPPPRPTGKSAARSLSSSAQRRPFRVFGLGVRLKQTIGFGIVLRAVELHGEPRVELPDGPPFFRYSDAEECKRGLIVAGFESPTVTKVSQIWRLPAGDGLFNAMKDSTVRTAGLLRAQKPTVLNKIRDAMRAELEKYTKRRFRRTTDAGADCGGVKRLGKD